MKTGIILLVEDSVDDVELTRRIFRQCRIRNAIRVVSNGEDAHAYLQGIGVYGNRDAHPEPVLTLLDLQLPRMKGWEVLSALGRPQLTKLSPIVVLSGITDLKQVQECYKLGSTSFLIKPLSTAEVLSLVNKSPRLVMSPAENGEYELNCV